jgi:hypothetical protein
MNTTKILDNGESNRLLNAVRNGRIDVHRSVARWKEKRTISKIRGDTYRKAGGFLTNVGKQSKRRTNQQPNGVE